MATLHGSVIKDIVQELVDGPAWAAGNAMMFVFPIISVYSSDEYRQYWTWFENRTQICLLHMKVK